MINHYPYTTKNDSKRKRSVSVFIFNDILIYIYAALFLLKTISIMYNINYDFIQYYYS